MSPSAPAGETFKLELVDDVPRAVTPEAAPVVAAEALPRAAPTAAVGAPRAATAGPGGDPFVAQAMRERDGGVVDAALWNRSMLLAGGDEAAAVAPYLRARATALRLAQRRAMPSAPQPGADPASAAGGAAKRRPGYGSRPVVFALAAVAVAVLLTLAWALWWPPASAPASEAGPAGQGHVPAAPGKASAVAPAAPVAATAPDPSIELAAKVAALKQAGNWNVLVLYASEWTRKDPDQASAWAALSEGYAKLGQADDALAAARKAVELEPSNPVHQRRLAEIYQGLERPEDALAALEKALAADGGHAETLARAGRLYLDLGRLPDAKSAFDRALALDAASTPAACGALEVARRQGRTRDADALAKAMKDAHVACPEPSRAVAVPAAPAVSRTAAPPGRR